MKISRVLAMTLVATSLVACGGGSNDAPAVTTRHQLLLIQILL